MRFLSLPSEFVIVRENNDNDCLYDCLMPIYDYLNFQNADVLIIRNHTSVNWASLGKQEHPV